MEAHFAHAGHGQIELVAGDSNDTQVEHTAVRIAVDVLGVALAARGATAAAKDNVDVHQDRDCVAHACQHGGGYGKDGEQHERLPQVVVLAGFPRWA